MRGQWPCKERKGSVKILHDRTLCPDVSVSTCTPISIYLLHTRAKEFRLPSIGHDITFGCSIKGNVAVYKYQNLEFVTMFNFCHEFAARKCN